MISYTEAQELHLLIGGPIEVALDRYDIAGAKPDFVMVRVEELERARELVALIVTDTTPSPVSYAPCLTGKVEIEGAVSEFMIPLENDSVGFSQWGAPNEVLWSRVELLDTLSGPAREWWADNRPEGEPDA